MTTLVTLDHQLEHEKHAKYRGSFNIRIDCINYKNTLIIGGKSQQKENQSLERLLEEENCSRRDNARYHAMALISPSILAESLRISGLDESNLKFTSAPYPRLELPDGIKLDCLHGSGRLAAANRLLSGPDKWWVIDLLLDGMFSINYIVTHLTIFKDISDNLRTMITEEYDYQKHPDDGELYNKIRKYQGIGSPRQPLFENIWLGRLSISRSRRANFDKLMRNTAYVQAFDELLQIPALLGGLRLSVVHHMLRMRCEEVY